MKRVAGFTETIYPFPLSADFFEMNPDVLLGAKAFPAKPYNEGYVNRFERWAMFPQLPDKAQ
ncbi:hypothetical protein ASG89_35005 [Paenibacillus sp. Soil766]|uniref:hypothetical protein n=1 Tax=Paenibacillus sp. Soil766 TaxID=1736404 RepID=UPI000710BF52|nr:hypothetical protein [Paenibacillus sp. Soil766]KRE85294.1 hypothetical protein ASG89_35005 [Paenibacillus sp. Soil766]